MARQWLARVSATLLSGIILLAGAPMLVAAGEAATPGGTVNLGNSAVTRAGGAAITMAVTVKCSPVTTPPPPLPLPVGERTVSVQVVQALGSSTTSGYGSASVVCDNAAHTVKVDVMVSAPGAPFKPGIAFARADLYECGPEFCGSITDADEIRIVR